MAPLDSRASTACLGSWQLFLVWKVMHWSVSWSRCRKDMPTPSLAVLVARQVPSKLRHCGAKSARQAPTCNLSAAAGWGSWNSSPGLPVLGWNGMVMVTGSLAGTGTKGLILGDSLLNGGSCLQRCQPLENWSSGLLGLCGSSLYHAGLCWVLGPMKVTDDLWRSQMTRPYDPPAGWSEPAVGVLWVLDPGRGNLQREQSAPYSELEAGSQNSEDMCPAGAVGG